MEIDRIFYRAKDGRIFTDPLKCEAYEKTIGILQGSVGMLVNELEKHNAESYINGMVLVKTRKGMDAAIMLSASLDDYLESFVNVNDLTKDQRYIYETVGGLIKYLARYDKDLPCQYMILLSDTPDSAKSKTAMANYNPEIWKDMEDKA